MSVLQCIECGNVVVLHPPKYRCLKCGGLLEYKVAYEKLKDAVYKRRGWNQNGVPTVEKVKALGIDFPDVIELLKHNI